MESDFKVFGEEYTELSYQQALLMPPESSTPSSALHLAPAISIIIGSSPVIENCACTYSYRTATPTSSAFSILS